MTRIWGFPVRARIGSTETEKIDGPSQQTPLGSSFFARNERAFKERKFAQIGQGKLEFREYFGKIPAN